MNSASAWHSAFEPHRPAAVDFEATADLRPSSLVESQPGSDAWRREVAARLARYRTRRKPRAPRYPSLLLPFDSAEKWSHPLVTAAPCIHAEPDGGPMHEENFGPEPFARLDAPHDRADDPGNAHLIAHPELRANPVPEATSKVIEFPRSAVIPVVHASLLADPVFDRPRIVEAPEVVPPAPALGGILIDPIQPEPPDRHAAALLVCSASVLHRMLAACVDALILAAALSIFSAIFLRVNPILGSNPVHGPLPLLGGLGGAFAVLLWMTYQFLFIIGTGSTPGLRIAKLQISTLGGAPVTRRTCLWRVLASFLSAFSAGLGYLWCFLDQDSLCWHDRITRTHVQSVRSIRS